MKKSLYTFTLRVYFTPKSVFPPIKKITCVLFFDALQHIKELLKSVRDTWDTFLVNKIHDLGPIIVRIEVTRRSFLIPFKLSRVLWLFSLHLKYPTQCVTSLVYQDHEYHALGCLNLIFKYYIYVPELNVYGIRQPSFLFPLACSIFIKLVLLCISKAWVFG